MKADIFLLTDIKPPKRTDGHYCYQIRSFRANGEEWDVWSIHNMELPAFVIENVTQNEAELTALHEALKRINKPCELTIYTDCAYIKQCLECWIQGWIESNWVNAKGKPVAFAEQWQEILNLLKPHTYELRIKEQHEFYKIMQLTIERSKNNV